MAPSVSRYQWRQQWWWQWLLPCHRPIGSGSCPYGQNHQASTYIHQRIANVVSTLGYSTLCLRRVTACPCPTGFPNHRTCLRLQGWPPPSWFFSGCWSPYPGGLPPTVLDHGYFQGVITGSQPSRPVSYTLEMTSLGGSSCSVISTDIYYVTVLGVGDGEETVSI